MICLAPKQQSGFLVTHTVSSFSSPLDCFANFQDFVLLSKLPHANLPACSFKFCH